MADVNVSGTGETAAPPAAPAAPVATPQAPTTPVAATPATPPAPATQGPDGWVPSYRVRETREAALREAQAGYTAKEQEWQAKYNQIQSQLHALVGVQPPQNPEADAVKQQFYNLFPQLKKLEERGEDVLGMLERAGDLESQNSHYWQSYGRQAMDRLFEHASTSLGTPLTDEGKRALHSAFTGFVQSSPELTDRYANDPTLIEDFWKMFTSSFIDPSRRAASAQVAGRAALGASLPQDSPSGAPRVPGAPKPANLDERASSAWALYQANAKP